VSVRAAGLAFFDGGIPEVRGNASNTFVKSIDVGLVSRADTLPTVHVQIETFRAGEAFSGIGVPNSRSVTSNAVVVGVKMRSTGWALTLEGFLVEHQSVAASHTS